MKKIIQVLGPTGVGKSKISIELAKKFNGEIISADSCQVYHGFDIGTDKISLRDRQNVPHHLIDIINDCSQFNVSIFLEKAFSISEHMIQRGKIPIVCGGTALYLRTMIKGIFPENEKKRISRDTLNRIANRIGLSKLWEKLNQVDTQYATQIGKNDKIRIVRALEIYYNNGTPPSKIFLKTQSPFKDYQFIRIGLNLPREELYQRIEKRVDHMIKKGLVEEVQQLLKIYPLSSPPFKSLGYKELLMYLIHHEITLEEAIQLIKQHSRNFAKRQLSWFRQEKDILWFEPQQLKEIIDFLSKNYFSTI